MTKLKQSSTSQPNLFVFGASSALITNLGLIVGLYLMPNARLNIIGSILVVALADNISDSLGIHIYQEAQKFRSSDVWISTLTNFLTRFFVSVIFIVFFLFMPVLAAVYWSLIYGLISLSIISYHIALERKVNPWWVITEHLAIAIVVIVLSRYAGMLIATKF
jgi:vacuolar iron transporter family protein